MTTVAANDYQVCSLFFRSAVNFDLGFAQYDGLVLRIYIVLLGKTSHLLCGLLLNLFLYAGEIHRDIAAIGEAQWLDDMDKMQFRTICISKNSRSLHYGC